MGNRPASRIVRHAAGTDERPADAWLVSHQWAGVPYLSVARTKTGYLVRSHEFADFLVSEDGSTIDVFPLQQVSEAQLSEVLEQQILPGIHQLAGCPAVHASAISTPDGTIAFLGPSGSGKSTI